jgi:hypothetical protein
MFEGLAKGYQGSLLHVLSNTTLFACCCLCYNMPILRLCL